MKANRASRSLCALRADEQGASEIVGYMIAFAMSSMILVLSLTGFNMMRDHSGDLVADRTVKEIGHRVSFAVEEALHSGANFPESNFSRTIRMPAQVSGNTYRIDLGSHNVWANLTDPGPAAQDENGNDLDTMGRVNVTITKRANAKVLCTGGSKELPGQATCRVYSSDEKVLVEYGALEIAGETVRGVYLKRP